MIPYARLRPGPGFRPWRALGYYAFRLAGADRHARAAVSAALSRSLRMVAPPPGAAPDATALATLRHDGIVGLPALLPPEAVAEMRRFLERRPVQELGGAGRRFLPAERPAGVAQAGYATDDILACPHALALINHPQVLALAGAYLGCSPTISTWGIRWSWPGDAGGGPMPTQRFHRDRDDWLTVKLFLFLTDVDADCGPHVFVAGSHRESQGLRTRTIAPESLASRPLRSLTGPAGTLFLADTAGIHRGEPPRRRPRLIMQIGYSLLPVMAFDYPPPAPAPEAATGLALDRRVNRLLVAPSGSAPLSAS